MAVSLSVSASWLKDNINNPNVKIVDGTWHLPLWKRDSQAEYLSQHIEGSVKFNVDAIADKSAPLPRTVPSLELFEEHMGKSREPDSDPILIFERMEIGSGYKPNINLCSAARFLHANQIALGIKSTDHVVIYDNNSNFGMFSAPRVWFMFKLYGHEKVSVLDGGLPKWLAEDGSVVSGPQPNVEAVAYKGIYHKELHRTFEEMLEVYKTNPSQILDARPVGRFEGRDPEPNPKIPSGRIIGSKNLFWRSFIDSDTKMIKDVDQIKKVFADAKVNLDDPNTASCGSGMSACWIAFAASHCDKTIPVYTGSWIEWYKRGPEDSKIIGVKGEDLSK